MPASPKLEESRLPGGGRRVFAAVDIGDEVRAEVARARGAIQARLEAAREVPRVAWVAPQAIHLTLRFFGEVGEDIVTSLRESLSIPFEIAPFQVEWRGFGAFPGPRHPRALWMGVVAGAAKLGELEAALSCRLTAKMRGAGGAEEVRPFRPHLTIGRVRIAGKGVDWEKILSEIDVRGAISLVDHVTLYQSRLSPKGPQYTGLAKAPLLP